MNKSEHAQVVGEALAASAASKVTYAGSGSAVLGWFLSSEAAVFFGILLGLAGFITNLVFSWRRDRREERALRAKEGRQEG